MAKSKIPSESWNEIDVDTLTPALKKLYKAYKAAAAAASIAREEFNVGLEKVIRGMDGVATDEQTVVIGHNFGKVSFAVTDEAPKARGGGSSREKFRLS